MDVVSDDDYRRLGDARAFNARNDLLEKGQLERQRVFIVEPHAGKPEKGIRNKRMAPEAGGIQPEIDH